MDWISLLSAIGFSGVVTAIVGAFQHRRLNRATADNSSADYAAKILAQSDERVKHALDDRDRALADRDQALKERSDAYAEAKAQRKFKQEWREKFYEEQRAKHGVELALKDTQAILQVSEHHRCEVMACSKRVPPRKEE